MAKVTFGTHGENAQVELGGRYTQNGKNWQYFKVVERNNRKSEFAVDLNTKEVIRGRASQEFVAAVLESFGL